MSLPSEICPEPSSAARQSAAQVGGALLDFAGPVDRKSCSSTDSTETVFELADAVRELPNLRQARGEPVDRFG